VKRFGSLVPARVLEGGRARFVRVVDDVLLVQDDTGAAIYRAGVDAPIARLARGGTPEPADVLAGSFLLRHEADKVVAYDVKTLSAKWTWKRPTLEAYVESAVTSLGGEVVVLRFRRTVTATSELEAIDPTSGVVRWRVPPVSGESGIEGPLHASANRILVRIGNRLTGLDATTGATFWSREPGFNVAVVTADRIVGRLGGMTFRVLDAATGKDAEEIPGAADAFDGGLVAADVSGGTFFGVTHAKTVTSAVLVAVDLAAARVKWSTAIPSHDAPELLARNDRLSPLSWMMSSPAPRTLVANDDVVVGASTDGLLRAWDVRDGVLRWSWPLHGDSSVAQLDGPPYALYAIDHARHVQVFTEGTALSEHATIRGQVTLNGKPVAGEQIFVDAATVTTDRAGKFSHTLDGVGMVHVRVLSPRGDPNPHNPVMTVCSVSGEELVPLEGKGIYDVRVKVTSGCQSY
jgi:outer membrane protein assembly factor BamB